MIVEIENLSAGYGAGPVVREFEMQVDEGAIVCLLGPSGCGKTTVLRALAGFNPIETGSIRMRGEVVSYPDYTRAPECRKVGMVFQDYALFPHLSVSDNISFGLRRRSGRKARERVGSLLTMVGLSGCSERFPHELSGGEQQRIALARALAPQPDIVLLDEPFSNLDVELRERLSADVADILRAGKTTAILVTHDQREAFALGDRVGVMRAGTVEQWDTPFNVYHEPKCRFVADFIGQGVFIRGALRADDSVDTPLGVLRGRGPIAHPPGAAVDVLLRPDDVVADPEGPIEAAVVRKLFMGAGTLYELRSEGGSSLLSLLPSHLDLAVGSAIRIRILADHLVVFPVESD